MTQKNYTRESSAELQVSYLPESLSDRSQAAQSQGSAEESEGAPPPQFATTTTTTTTTTSTNIDDHLVRPSLTHMRESEGIEEPSVSDSFVRDFPGTDARLLGALEERVSLLVERRVKEILRDRENGENMSDEMVEHIAEDGHELYETRLTPDAFSFLITTTPFSTPFMTGAIVLTLKTLIYYLILANLIDWSSPFNQLNIPVSVPQAVSVSQFFAFFISVLTQNDVLASLVYLYEGYSEEIANISEGWGGGVAQWLTAIAVTFVDGMLGLVSTFLLVVNSGTVLDVLLNFAAVEFVSDLDESAFYLAHKGFLGGQNSREAEKILNATYYVRRRKRTLQVLGPIIILMFISGLWALILVNQANGIYAPRALIVQFDDVVRPSLAAHSSFYFLDTRPFAATFARFRYFEGRGGAGVFVYCQKQRQWTFLIDSQDACGDGIEATSSQSDSYDITAPATNPWFAVREGSGYASPMENFQLRFGCQDDNDCGGTSQGLCLEYRCRCVNGYSGLQCSFLFADICPKVSINGLFSPQFPAPREIATEFTWTNNIMVYDRAFYMNNQTKARDLILYTGVRWALTSVETGFNNISNEALFAMLQPPPEEPLFDAANISNIDMLSEPVWYGSAQDNSLTPVDLEWFVVPGSTNLANARDLVSPTDPVQLLCSVCNNNTNPCFYNNECVEGTCNCTNGASGTLCQIEPGGNGRCDNFFNTPQFDFDGGDCCEATCVSTTANRCGIIEGPDELSTVVIGFPTCRATDLVEACPNGGQSLCYIRSSDSIAPFSFSEVIPTLSANGRILVLAEPEFDTVRVFDIEDSRWVLRGARLAGEVNSNFGGSVDMTTLPGAVVEQRTGRIPIYLAISAGAAFSPHVDLYSWPVTASSWQEEEIDLVTFGICSKGVFCDFRVKVGKGSINETDTDSLDTFDTLVTVMVILGRQNYALYRAEEEVTWRNQLLPDADMVAMSGNGLVIGLYNQTDLNITFYSFDDRVKSFTPSLQTPFTIPSEIETSSLQVDAMELSDHAENFGIVFHDNANHSFVQRYATGLEFLGLGKFILLAEQRIELPYSTVSFSVDGNAGAILLTLQSLGSNNETRDVFTTFSFNEVTDTFDELGNLVAGGFSGASISESGDVLAFVGNTATEIHTVNHRCKQGKMVFRLSLTLDSFPGTVAWSLGAVSTFRGVVLTDFFIHTCDFCYADGDSFARTIVVEDYCIPQNQSECLEFRFFDNAPPLGPGAGYEAFLYEPNAQSDNRTVFGQGQGFDASQTFTRTLGNCERADPFPPCGENETQFVLALTLDSFPSQTSWTLESVSNRTIVWESSTYNSSLSFDWGATCLPQNTCWNFTMRDAAGDGMCCDSGFGGYVGFYGDQVFQGGNFTFEASHIFGDCN